MKISTLTLLAILLIPIRNAFAQELLGVADKSTSAHVDAVDLFEALSTKQLAVKVIPLGAHQANMVFANRTDHPLIVNLPQQFAAVQVLGQFGPGGGAGGFAQGVGPGQGGIGQGAGQFGAGAGGGAGGGGSQAIGGGFGGGGGFAGAGGLNGGGIGGGQLGGQFGGGQIGGGGFGNAGFGGGGGGFFRVEPGKSRKLSINTVCLEHGKRDPNPRLQYCLVPLEQVNADPIVAALCKSLGTGQASQNVVQAAVWHHANGLSWESLAKKNRLESQFAGNEKFFSSAELQAARELSVTARELSVIARSANRLASANPDQSPGYDKPLVTNVGPD